MYLLRLLGRIVSTSAPEEHVATHPLIANFNKMFRYLHHYLGERVGNVGTNLLRKYYEDIQRSQPDIFAGVSMLADGQLSPAQLQKNLKRLDGEDVDLILDEAMNEFLNMCILAVTKVLGSEHETHVIEEIGSLS